MEKYTFPEILQKIDLLFQNFIISNTKQTNKQSNKQTRKQKHRQKR